MARSPAAVLALLTAAGCSPAGVWDVSIADTAEPRWTCALDLTERNGALAGTLSECQSNCSSRICAELAPAVTGSVSGARVRLQLQITTHSPIPGDTAVSTNPPMEVSVTATLSSDRRRIEGTFDEPDGGTIPVWTFSATRRE